MIQHSDSIQTIMAALSEVQSDTDHVDKDLRNPHYGNTYASLNAFLRALRPALKAQGVVMTQSPGMDDDRLVVDTMLYHMGSGEWLRSRAMTPLPKDDPQGVGSATTYLRRYSLAALFALPQEDDDGNAASRTPSSGQQGVNKDTGEIAEYPCPECGGELWDNRDDPKAARNGGKRPDWKCKDKECDHAIWGKHPDEEESDPDPDVDQLVEDVSDLLDTAASLNLVDVKRSANIEKAVKNKNADVLRIAHDWLKRQVEKASEEEGAEEERETVAAGSDDGQEGMPF